MTKRDRLLTLLSDRHWHLTSETNAITYRYSSYICDWRKEGYNIEGECVDHATGLWRFRLVSTPRQAALIPHLERTARTVAQMQEDGLEKRRELVASQPRRLWDD